MKWFILIPVIILAFTATVNATYDYTITGGYPDDITLTNSQTLLMTGGGMYRLTAKDYSILYIQNTSSPLAVDVGGIWDLLLGGCSQLKFSGGGINRIDIDGYAKAVLSGGKINTLRNYNSQPVYDKRIEMLVRDYVYNSSTKKLSGTWNVDNNNDSLFDAFNIQLSDSPQYTYTPTIDIIKFTIIPEPATLLLLTLGGIFMRTKVKASFEKEIS